MKKIGLRQIARVYSNNGQHAEMLARYTLTGDAGRADNIPATAAGDCGDIQIKSARATICKGLSIASHLAQDAAKRYAFVSLSENALYLMSKSEYENFAETFKTATTESAKNGGAVKLRLKSESKAMLDYLNARA